jgi:hypothetical protein
MTQPTNTDEFFSSGRTFPMPSWICPAHGEVSTISVTITGMEAEYCIKCWVESFERIGVRKCTKK